MGATPYVLALWLAFPTPAASQVQAVPELRRLEFGGNAAFPADSLRRAIVNRETECRPVLALFCWLGMGFADDPRYLDRRELPRDMARLKIYYWQRGFREATIDTAVAFARPSEATVTFRIEEGQPVLVGSLEIVGLEGVEVPGIFARLPLQVGEPLPDIGLDAVPDSLLSRLRNAGFAHADVLRSFLIPTETPYAAEVTYDVDPGPRSRFGDFDVSILRADSDTGGSAAPLSEGVVRRMLPFTNGDVYSREQIFEAQRNLYSLEIIRNAAIRERLDNFPDSLVPLEIDVRTEDQHRVRWGGGWSGADCISAEAEWASRSFLGGGRRLRLRGRLSNILAHDLRGTACRQAGEGRFADLNWVTSIELNQPWIFSVRNSLTASLFWERQSLPEVFIRKAAGLSAALTRSLGIRTAATLAYRPQLAQLEAAGIFFCTSFLVCTPEDVMVLEERNSLSPVGVSFSRDRTDNVLDPSDGYSALFDYEHASSVTGSDFAYNRVIGEVNFYESLAVRNVAAARARVGWVSAGAFTRLESGPDLAIVHPQKRFYAGGPSSVRGFPQNGLGPRVLTVDVGDLLSPLPSDGGDTTSRGAPCQPERIVDRSCDVNAAGDSLFVAQPTGGTRVLEATVEYRFAFGRNFQAVTFLDVGQVWGESESIDLGSLEWAPGLGVRYFSPIGPLRVDVGYRFRGAEDLRVVTSQIESYDPSRHGEDDRITISDRGALTPIPWVRIDDLSRLDSRARFGASGSFFRQLQLHVSIGQAF